MTTRRLCLALLVSSALILATPVLAAPPGVAGDAGMKRDHDAILGMAGDFKVRFDMRETVSLTPGYKLLEPKVSGGVEAVRRITGLGAIAALGHTDADHATARAAIDAGARHATHLFNAMRPLRHRDPGPVVALLEDPRVTVELIRDGVHLDGALCSWLDSSVAPSRLVAVTDAMAAAGSPDGRYALGDLTVVVEERVARIDGTSTLAGSTATMDVLFRSAAGDLADEALARATAQTAANPARLLGLADRGRLAAGARADVVVLAADSLEVRRVMRAGSWVTSR